MNQNITVKEVESVVGTVDMWTEEANAISFRPSHPITLKQLQAVSDLFGTDRIDIFTGQDGDGNKNDSEPGEVTVYKNAA